VRALTGLPWRLDKDSVEE